MNLLSEKDAQNIRLIATYENSKNANDRGNSCFRKRFKAYYRA